uniref:Atg9 n=1 Tax=Arundo donax TaxID=35708 RepID=A0A0A9GTI5_ARUDO
MHKQGLSCHGEDSHHYRHNCLLIFHLK